MEKLVENILTKRFTDVKRREIYHFPNRLNFSCPYCGDSEYGYKKRGNLYIDRGFYKCYNGGCEIYKPVLQFFRDWDERVTDLEYIERVSNLKRDHKSVQVWETPDVLKLSVSGINREEFRKLYRLTEIQGTEGERWLKSRFLGSIENRRYLWNKMGSVWILNLIGENVVGAQIRMFDSGAKYVSRDLNRIRTDNGLEPVEDSVNWLSRFFGLSTTDWSKPVWIFEGPLDSFWVENSIALSGVSNNTDWLDDVESARYFLDNDRAGYDKSKKLIKLGKSVFLWSKAQKAFQFPDEIKDFTDLINWAYQNRVNIKTWKEYFSNNPMDLIWL